MNCDQKWKSATLLALKGIRYLISRVSLFGLPPPVDVCGNLKGLPIYIQITTCWRGFSGREMVLGTLREGHLLSSLVSSVLRSQEEVVSHTQLLHPTGLIRITNGGWSTAFEHLFIQSVIFAFGGRQRAVLLFSSTGPLSWLPAGLLCGDRLHCKCTVPYLNHHCQSCMNFIPFLSFSPLWLIIQ